MENYALYDSDLNSENEEAKFESDHEPPKEQVHDKKAIYKSNDLKIYRTILQVNSLNLQPVTSAIGWKGHPPSS